MQLKILGTKITVTFPFLALISILLIIDKTKGIGIILLSVFLHECGHLVMMKFLFEQPKEIILSLIGASIVKKESGYKNEKLIAFAGPFVNLLAAVILYLIYLFVRNQILLYAAAINFTLAIFNLLPVASFDGSKILKSFLSLKYGYEKAIAIKRKISICCLSILMIFGVILFLNERKNPTLVITAVYMIIIEIRNN